MSNLRVKNIIKYVLPTILGNVCFFLFTVVDGIFVGRGVGINGLGAVNLAIPFTMIVMALFTVLSIGGVAIFAIKIGKGDIDGANNIFCHGMIVLGITSVILSAAGVLFANQICTLLGATETFHQMAVDYMFWYSLFIVPSGLSFGLQNYCRNDGAPGLVGGVVIGTTILNIFGDWLCIFPLSMGTKGAALATGISQTVSFFILLAHLLRKKGILRFGKIKFDGAILKDIVIHGLPEGIGQLATPVTTMCMNLVLVSKIGDVGVTAFSVICSVASLTIAVFIGTSEGFQPLFGQNYGAKNETDLKFYFRISLIIGLIGSAMVVGLMLIFSRPFCVLFGSDPATLDYAISVMPVYSWGFVVMSFNVLISAYLYSTDRAVHAVIINVLRGIVVNVAVILLVPDLFGPDAIWTTPGIYELIVLAVAFGLLKHSERNGVIFK